MLSAVGYQQSQDLEWPDMAWAKPVYSRKKVDEAGLAYINPDTSPEDREIALTAITNWRSSHNFPLNTLQVNLRRGANGHDSDPTVALIEESYAS